MKLRAQIFFSLFFCMHIYTTAYTETISYFSPTEDITGTLIETIKKAKKSVFVAMYCFTDKQIASALIEAFDRGIDVKVIVDQMSSSRYGKAEFLFNAKIPVFIFTPQSNRWGEGPLMHHKFAIFDNELVWTGSFNWTVSGNNSNQENVVTIANKALAGRFKQIFTALIKDCIPFGLYKSTKESHLREEINALLESYCNDRELANNLAKLLQSYSLKTASIALAGAASNDGIARGKHSKK